MAGSLGVRSYVNALLIANLYKNIPRKNLDIYRFAKRILNPRVLVNTLDCGTVIGTKMSTEQDVIGTIALDTDKPITHEYLLEQYAKGIYYVRVRDTSTCTSRSGVCAKCYRGHLISTAIAHNNTGAQDQVDVSALLDKPASEYVGSSVLIPGNPVSYQRHIALTYSGSLVGVSPVPAGPLPLRPGLWKTLVGHSEMDAICDQLEKLDISQDEAEYIRNVKDELERALIIIAYYGVYGCVTN